MKVHIEYTSRERFWLAVLAAIGFTGINGAFVFGLLFRPSPFASILSDPIALAFIVEAMVLVGVLAYLFERWGVSRVRWGWFVALSLIGGLAFSIPVALLARRDTVSSPEAPDRR